jgi:hypothetical protein
VRWTRAYLSGYSLSWLANDGGLDTPKYADLGDRNDPLSASLTADNSMLTGLEYVLSVRGSRAAVVGVGAD